MGMYDPVATNHIDLDLYWVVKLVQIVVAVQVEPSKEVCAVPVIRVHVDLVRKVDDSEEDVFVVCWRRILRT